MKDSMITPLTDSCRPLSYATVGCAGLLLNLIMCSLAVFLLFQVPCCVSGMIRLLFGHIPDRRAFFNPEFLPTAFSLGLILTSLGVKIDPFRRKSGKDPLPVSHDLDSKIVPAAFKLIGILAAMTLLGLMATNFLSRINPDLGTATLLALLFAAIPVGLYSIRDALKDTPALPVDQVPLPERGTPMGPKREND